LLATLASVILSAPNQAGSVGCIETNCSLNGVIAIMADTLEFYCGLSGIQLPMPKYQYPPAFQNASRLTYYATIFNSIEVNSSFYKIPMERTVSKWAHSVGSDFSFTFKLFKEITHCKNLNFSDEHIQLFFNTISQAHIRKGFVLVQFPPSLTFESFRQFETLMNSLHSANMNHRWRIAVEFRNKSWYNENVFDVLNSYNASMVLQDIPKSASPMITTTDFVYVRFHGPTGNYGGTYSEAFLAEYAAYIKEWLSEGKTVYAYFNNTKGDAYRNANTLKQVVSN
jgi:uncharacterized protein YecE (DUF72 family)